MRLSLYYPTYPFIVTQGWGIKNPAYEQFGFSAHNGVDFLLDKDAKVRAMCDGVVTDVGYVEKGAGNFVKWRTGLVFAEGAECFVEFVYMHAEKILVKTGDKVNIFTDLMIADNTGFSTGPHTHISAYRIGTDGKRLDLDKATNFTFDFSKYFNGKFANLAEPFLYNLSYGMRGKDVERLQQVLTEMGFYRFEITGFYGAITAQAVLDFQISHKVINLWERLYYTKERSLVGPKTRAKLNSLL
jgi:murein DD-endopeptidase MepM/ murein hydrolase activator NlpD